MNCTQVCAALPALVYDALPPEETRILREHLAGCSSCRKEHAALQRLKGVLDTVPAPAVRVDLSQLYQEAARRQQGQLRRWRRAALVGCAAAAAVLVALALKLEVHVGGHQVVVRWGPPPAVIPAPAPAAGAPAGVSAEELQLVKQLVHVLADDVAARDRQHQEAILWLQGRVAALQRQAQERWNATERYVSALYTLNANLVHKE
jgi:hypothetical protein